MKKYKIALLCLLTGSVLLLTVFQAYTYIHRDSVAPVISCPDGVLSVRISATDADFLRGVTAQDDKDGDLSGSVVVEGLSAMDRDGIRTATYAVMDLSGNVGRASRAIRYTDYEKPRIYLDTAPRFLNATEIFNLLSHVQASSVLDGDISSKVKYQFLNSGVISGEGFYPISLRVNDSAGNSTILTTELEIYNPRDELLHFELTDYVVYLKQGEPFDPENYYEAEELTGEMHIDSNVNPEIPGTYTVTYTLENTASDLSGKSRLIVIVEE